MIEKGSLKFQQICRAILICCDEKERLGIKNLYDSDISDIKEILRSQGHRVTENDIRNVLDMVLEDKKCEN